MRKRRFWIAALVVLLGGGAAAYFKTRKHEPKPVDVEAQAAARRTIVQTVTGNGRIQPKTKVEISADVSGKITNLAVKEGDWVEKGTLLVELERERYVAAVQMAEASLRAATSNAEMARENMLKAGKDYERSQGLYARQLEAAAIATPRAPIQMRRLLIASPASGRRRDPRRLPPRTRPGRSRFPGTGSR